MTFLTAFSDAAAAWRRRSLFSRICRACDLRLDYADCVEDVSILKEIFVDRIYSDWFPHRRRAVVVDAGAHRGFFTLFAARRLAPGSTIVAVEPEARNLTALERNLKANGAEGVRIVRAALAASTGEARLRLNSSQNHSLHPVHHDRIGRPSEPSHEVVVPTISLRDLTDREARTGVDFLKLDCEGGEYDALLDAEPAVLRRIGVISLEFHDLATPGKTGRDLAEHLESAGFRLARFEHGPTTIDNDYGHIVAVRSGGSSS